MKQETEVSREIYPHAPLALVAFELRTSHVPEFDSRTGAIALYEQLRQELPIIPPARQPVFELSTAGAGQQSVTPSTPLEMLDRRRVRSVVVSSNRLVVQTTEYVQFEAFRDFVRRVLEAASNVAAIEAIERVGLRYIDEIRIDGVEKPAEWRPYIDAGLLAPKRTALGLEASAFNTLVEFTLGEEQGVNMRVGAVKGRVIDPTGPLRVKSDSDGPFFLIDIDSFWAPPVDELPPFSADVVVDICSRLHEPSRALFESALTDRAREIFRGGETPNGR